MLNYSLKDQLQAAKNCLDSVISEVENTPQLEVLAGLIKACETIDTHYREFCDELDKDFEEEPITDSNLSSDG